MENSFIAIGTSKEFTERWARLVALDLFLDSLVDALFEHLENAKILLDNRSGLESLLEKNKAADDEQEYEYNSGRLMKCNQELSELAQNIKANAALFEAQKLKLMQKANNLPLEKKNEILSDLTFFTLFYERLNEVSIV
ncbi:MAG: hypothetical protein ACM3KR_07765 [Deltaproteobacteria bacterium]